MTVLDAGDENLVKDIGKSLQKLNKSFPQDLVISLFFPLESVLPMISLCKKWRGDILYQMTLFLQITTDHQTKITEI